VGDIKRVVPDYDEKEGYELAGFAWFQGWNDMVDGGTYPNRDRPGGYDAYSSAMAHFIRDVRKDLGAPELPFIIGVLGVGGPTAEYGPDQQRYKSTHDNFRNAMAAPAKLPEFKGNVAAVLTEQYWDQERRRTRSGSRRRSSPRGAN
jgi:Carbohydrate esterase, sialic acid-specific acetylesterase